VNPSDLPENRASGPQNRDFSASRPPEAVEQARDASGWSSRPWRVAAVAWIDEALGSHGIRRTADAEQVSIRAWATVLRVPSSVGPLWFKASARESAFEAGLAELLARVVPRQALHPLATDADRGWLLLPDGGPSLASQLDHVDPVAVLERVLPEYGALQLALAPHSRELLELGLGDLRAERMPHAFDEAAEAVRASVTDADRERHARVLAFRPEYVRWTEELAQSPVPVSIDHNDLHAGNVLLPPADASVHARFYDWGDAAVAHPFATMGARPRLGAAAPRCRPAASEHPARA
jgi:Phosphotransferase enzyme family